MDVGWKIGHLPQTNETIFFTFSGGVSSHSSVPEGVECLEHRSLTQQGQITISLQDRDGLLQSLAARFY
jgi:hypothetical protein